MKILFVRHGETEWNRTGKIQGGTDIPLNQNGIRQAQITRTLLQSRMPDYIFCSPLQRAMQTAVCIAADTNIPILADDRLRERGYGAFEGKLFSSVDFSGIWYPGSSNVPAGIEPLDAFVQRVAAAFREIRTAYAGKRVLIVSHGGVSIAASILINHTPQNQNSKALYIDNCTVAEYDLQNL